MKRYFAFMEKYYPDGDKNSNFNTYGYSAAQLLVHVLKECGDNLTRAAKNKYKFYKICTTTK